MGYFERMLLDNFHLFGFFILFSEIFVFLIVMLISISLVFRREKVDLKNFLTKLIFCILLLTITKLFLDKFFGVERPYIFYGYEVFRSVFPENKAFISGHSSFSMMLSLLSFSISPLIGYINLFLSILGGISRLIILLHWPRDIILGWWFGFLIFLISNFIFKSKK
jgi:membrane-associated phospholipid phosphatase